MLFKSTLCIRRRVAKVWRKSFQRKPRISAREGRAEHQAIKLAVLDWRSARRVGGFLATSALPNLILADG